MVCPSLGGKTTLGRGSWTFTLAWPNPDATRWGTQESKKFFQLSSQSRLGSSRYCLGDLLVTLTPTPERSEEAPEAPSQEPGNAEVQPQAPEYAVIQLVGQEPSGVAQEAQVMAK